jgi:hypothetical protein
LRIRDTDAASSSTEPTSMSKFTIHMSYLQSLLWLALFVALIGAESNIVELLFIDFVHGNPHRSQENALSMMKADTPVSGVIAFIGTFLVFTLPQFFQAECVVALERPFGDRARFAVLFALPVTAVLTWYCYDYLTPSNLCFAGNCMEPYEHGLSVSRYMTAVVIQTPIALFSFLYFDAGLCGRSKKPILLATLAVTLVAGGIRGYLMARAQFQFL